MTLPSPLEGDRLLDNAGSVARLRGDHLCKMWLTCRIIETTLGQLLPFFQLPGLVTVDQSTVSVPFRPFNDRQLNEDLTILFQCVSRAAPHLSDGRRLLLVVGNIHRPIL